MGNAVNRASVAAPAAPYARFAGRGGAGPPLTSGLRDAAAPGRLLCLVCRVRRRTRPARPAPGADREPVTAAGQAG